MNPADFGLPPKFAKWRAGQFDAVLDVASRPERFVACAMPTGAGKSAFYVAVIKLLGGRGLVLTSNKGLQNQLTADFGPIGMVDVRGQANYRCRALDDSRDGRQLRVLWSMGADAKPEFASPGSGCDAGPCHAGLECPYRIGGCAYYDQVAAASKAALTVTNYDYWMTQNRYGQLPLGKFDVLVLDEAHDAADKLSDFCSVSVNREEVDALLGLDLPSADAGFDFWISWSSKWAIELDRMLDAARQKKATRKVKRIRDLFDKLQFIAAAGMWARSNPANPDVRMPGAVPDWVTEEDGHGVRFTPVWPHGYAERFLFANTPKVILTSATLMPGTLKYLGLQP